ncbi:hypothetical protein MPTK1_6g11100 [Marchantia polymorpha subsp. ruderalis]|uniref:Uncharacterized protein n=2 Tax=Marchantia polymorpha TaxID=3197 RepID=A0AAF6BQT6_MARPO|nr:hypothetical protein MARPO_0016s0149 [Marchantia polymorpha]BBN14370.1 hypothetical protein Mp_6g11100 [Marchantia polymorpha subsp. ruderalis]|eukprot:PTQ45103.1 hypothetical protein MARPO_0016s0149 [Marchantia polymorpha]
MSSMQSAKDATKDTTEQAKVFGVQKADHAPEGTKHKASEGKDTTPKALNKAAEKDGLDGAKETLPGKPE